jgi:hypothetical protein
MSEIIDIRAREILDSRGNPTVEADVLTGVTVQSVGRLRRPARPPVLARRSNCVTATSGAISARAC